ncbi:hypothetical protein [Blastochloris tepida]|uniref:Uncharacterized protein n=1 Tax=Blastochloris tepida TaxID=2233851 RepID=A0A348G4J9_9HYPH|nr:hypothetical protein [Blastochloris tepida]BBF94482.1 hypothetical protein BLTE_31670 [Blastochloris tepida]
MFGFKSKKQRMAELFQNFALAEMQGERLKRFEETMVAQGYQPPCGERRDQKLCGAVAALFARQVNLGQAVPPLTPLSDHDFAVVWVALVATDMASQLTGADMELSMVAMPVWLCTPHVLSTSEDVVRLIKRPMNAHNRMMQAPGSQKISEDVASRFYDWSIKGYKEPIDVTRSRLADYVEILRDFRE